MVRIEAFPFYDDEEISVIERDLVQQQQNELILNNLTGHADETQLMLPGELDQLQPQQVQQRLVDAVIRELFLSNSIGLAERESSFRFKLGTILHHRDRFPQRQRDCIRLLVNKFILSTNGGAPPLFNNTNGVYNNNNTNTDERVDTFLRELGNDIHDMITSIEPLQERNVGIWAYYGLCSQRDTVAEVTMALRSFPEVLIRTKSYGGTEFLPIQCLTCFVGNDRKPVCNTHSAPFVPIFARVAIEFNLLTAHRGGLLSSVDRGENSKRRKRNIEVVTLDVLMRLSSSPSSELYNNNHNHAVDKTFCNILLKLREMGLLYPQDITKYSLLFRLFSTWGKSRRIDTNRKYFPKKRFRFLVDFYPKALTQVRSKNGGSPIHCFAKGVESIDDFLYVFYLVMNYFPYKKGICLWFQKNKIGVTPLELVCNSLNTVPGITTARVVQVVDDALATRVSSSNSDANTNTTATSSSGKKTTVSVPALNTVDALVLAAIDPKIHLSGVYYLLRRQPDVLCRLVRDGGGTGRQHGRNNSNTKTSTRTSEEGPTFAHRSTVKILLKKVKR